MLEGTDAKIHLIYYTPALEEARSRGDLATNSFVQLRKRFENGRPMLEVVSMGDAERLLSDEQLFRRKVPPAQKHLDEVIEQAWGGWLGALSSSGCLDDPALKNSRVDQERTVRASALWFAQATEVNCRLVT